MNDHSEELGVVPADQPIEIEDEYNLALTSDVEDESLLEPPSNSEFAITSYGADYTVDTIINRLKSDAFFVPQFQRRFVWSQRHASRFIESLLMGLPIPGIFLYKDPVTNRHMVVDGQQRLRTIQFFYDGLFGERKFKLIGVQKRWNDKTYKTLEPHEKLKIDDSIVHATIFQQDEPKNSLKSLHFVFERINSGGIRLSPQEIRNCISDGPLLDAIRALNQDPNWKKVFGRTGNNRLKDQELILRFLAMYERSDVYARPMKEFLNDFAADFMSPPEAKLVEFKTRFSLAIQVCADALGSKAFRPSRPLNAAVYEAVMLGVARRLAEKPGEIDPKNLAANYQTLLKDKTFMRACERATADEESVRTRHKLAIAAFGEI